MKRREKEKILCYMQYLNTTTIWQKFIQRDKRRTGNKILAPQKLITRFLVLLAKIKAGNDL